MRLLRHALPCALLVALALVPVAAATQPLGADTRISHVGQDGQTAPFAAAAAIAYDPRADRYLVVYQAQQVIGAGPDVESEVYGRLLDGQGAPVSGEIRLSDMGPDGNGSFAGYAPAVAYNSVNGEYLVVWNGDDVDEEFEVYGQRVSASGSEIGGDLRLSESGPDGNPAYKALIPAVVYNPQANEYLVAWAGTGSGTAIDEGEVFVQRVAPSGAEIGADARISDMGPNGNPAYDAGFPAVAYNGQANEYLVVWPGDDDTAPLVDDETEIFVQRLSSTGAEVGPNDVRISSMGPDGSPAFDALSPTVDYDSAANEYLVAWSGDDDAAGGVDEEFEIFVQRLSAAAGQVGSDTRISSMGGVGNPAFDAENPGLVYNPRADEYLVTWFGDDDAAPLVDDEFEVFAQGLTGAAAPIGSDTRISDLGPNGSTAFAAGGRAAIADYPPAPAYGSARNEYLIAFTGDDDTPPQVDDEVEAFVRRAEAGPPTSPAPAPLPPPAPAPAPAPADPAPAPVCQKQVAWGLVEITTTGCLAKDARGRWTTSAPVKVNGIPFTPVSGRQFVATPPGPGSPGGSVSLAQTSITLGTVKVFAGSVDWPLPDGGKGDEKEVATLPVLDAAKLFGLPIGGSIGLRLGMRADGTHYATFPVNVELPPIFSRSPDGSGGVSSTVAIRVDNAGVRFDGLRLQVAEAWVGKLKVESVCFSFVPAGGQAVETCPAPSLDGEPYVTCNEDVGTDRWDGNAVVVLPNGSATRLAAFGGVANNRLSKLGGFVDDLGTTVPLAQGVYLNRVGVGLCVYPAPFKIRGDVGVSVFPSPVGAAVLTVNGSILYTDPFQGKPWSIDLAGAILVKGTTVGTGKVTLRPTGSIDFTLGSGFERGPAKLTGSVVGWIETRNRSFLAQGNVTACVWTQCAKADGLVSSTGAAGCLDLGTVPVPQVQPANLVGYVGSLFGGRPTPPPVTVRTIPLKTGFGYRWGGTVSVPACDFGAYTPARLSPRRVQGGGTAFVVAAGTPALALRVAGQDGTPKLRLVGPDGTQIVSPETERVAFQQGAFLLAENPDDSSTAVVVVAPAAGQWSVEALPGSVAITGVEQSAYEAPAQVLATVSGSGERRLLRVGFTLPAGATLDLVERGDQVQRTLAGNVRGTPCRGAKALPDGTRLRCASVQFAPLAGPGGTREIVAVVSRDGLPLSSTVVASFRADGWAPAPRPRSVVLTRARDRVTVAWAVTGASRLAVSVEVGDGRKLAFDLAGRCRAVRIAGVPATAVVRARVVALREDLATGKPTRATLRAKAVRSATTRIAIRPLCR